MKVMHKSRTKADRHKRMDKRRMLPVKIVGFTPVNDQLVDELGLVGAAIFDKIWRYCQMKDRVCTASQLRIADELALGLSTVSKHVKILVELGYLIDTTPELLDKPHKYADAGKVEMMNIQLESILRRKAAER